MKKAKRIYGRHLNEMWKIGARHCLYHHEGGFYENLQRFPGALCDPKGYVRFETESEYQNSSYLNIGAKTTLNNRVDGIAGMPGYVRVTENTIE